MLVGAGARLVDMVVSPHALVESASRLRLHSIYYITKQVPVTQYSTCMNRNRQNLQKLLACFATANHDAQGKMH